LNWLTEANVFVGQEERHVRHPVLHVQEDVQEVPELGQVFEPELVGLLFRAHFDEERVLAVLFRSDLVDFLRSEEPTWK
jgi:hypothetical protein